MLVERRKDMRGDTPWGSVAKWAREAFGHLVKDKKDIYVFPKEMEMNNDDERLLVEKGILTKEELLEMVKVVDMEMNKGIAIPSYSKFLFGYEPGKEGKMKEWVKPYLFKNLMNMFYKISKQPAELKAKWIELKPKEFEEPESVFCDLTDFLQRDFGYGLAENLTFKKIFGSVLADLPFEVFEKLCGMKNVFFIYSPMQGSELKVFHLEKGMR
jgi:hypothetical protein